MNDMKTIKPLGASFFIADLPRCFMGDLTLGIYDLSNLGRTNLFRTIQLELEVFWHV